MRRMSIVIPTYEEEGISDAVDRLASHCRAIEGWELEVLIADDSKDATRARIRREIEENAARRAPHTTVRLVPADRRGKGNALRHGVLASTGEVVFWMDADLPVPLENVARFVALLDAGHDVVVAERPFDRNVRQPVRFAASRVLFALQRLVVFQSKAFEDTQCGFKAFRGDLARRLARAQIVDGGMVDIEYLYAATLDHARVARVAVTPNAETRPSKIDVRTAVVRDPIDLARIKLRGLTGGYARGG
jgi:glycosyltransferase involved in cell wall biosynthesis